MPKYFLLTSLALVFYLLLVSPVFSQESVGQLEKAKQDYLFQYNEYLTAHEKYLNSKNAYYKFGTVNARRQAIDDIKQTLVLRSEAMRTYLQLLKLTLIDIEGMDQSLQEAQVRKIELTQSFLENHKDNVALAQTITEINDVSGRYQREAVAIWALSWESLSVKVIGDAQTLEAETINVFNNLKQSIESNSDTGSKENIDEIEKQLSAIRLSMDRMTAILEDYRTNPKGDALGAFNAIKKEIDFFKFQLIETVKLIKELERAGMR